MEHEDVGALSSAQVAEFRAKGFVQGPRILGPSVAAAMLSAIEAIVRDPANPHHDQVYDMGGDGRPLLHLKNLWEHEPGFREVIDHPTIATALRQLTGRRYRLWQDGFFYKPPTIGSAHGWHQDIVHIPVDQLEGSIGVWLALTDVLDAGNGPMVMIPGSHRGGDAHGMLDDLPLPRLDEGNPVSPREGLEPAELCFMPSGFVHFHDGLTWHGSVANTSAVPRCGLLLFFVDDRAAYDGSHAAFDPAAHRAGVELSDADHPRVGPPGDEPTGAP